MIRYLLCAGIAGLLAVPSISLAGPAEYVRVCDAYGDGWFYIPGTETCINPETGATKEDSQNGTVDGTTELRDKADDALDGVALSLALPDATIDPGKTFGAAVGFGTFGGSTAIGIGGAFQAGDGFTVNGAVGASLDGGPVGGKAGVNFSW